jgi:hypothetical protein
MEDARDRWRNARARAMEQAPDGAKAREGRGVGVPKVGISPNGRARVDVDWSGVHASKHFVLFNLPSTGAELRQVARGKVWNFR